MSLFKNFIPETLHFLLDVNLSGFLSFILASIGMVVGSILSGKTNPPKEINFEK
ncbi:hypothetical protein [Candidatus Kryptonium thompsonii]|uniref:hypothetical protein n=1 Tax=Candidatus Kryptonium thompsonii TaxID=1633631 RepID=UPI00135210F9|nr:hypothetical protein [Candidatus Kryptonium thompsoni]